MVKKTPIKSSKKITTKRKGNTGKGGGQLNNKNAEKWTEHQAQQLGERLVKYMRRTKIPLMNEFLLIKEDLYLEIVSYLGKKYESFFKLLKKARDIQLVKIQKASLNGTNKSFYPIWFEKVNHGLSENKVHDRVGLETATEESLSISATNISNIYTKNYHSVKIGKNITINRGGTSSTKTVSLAQLAMTFLLTGKIGEKEGKEFDIVAKTLPHLKSTAMKEFWKYADLYNLSHYFDHHKTNKQITYKDRTISYFQTEDESKVKGRRRDFLWISEADLIDYETYRQLQMRTNLHTFLDFNPDNEYIYINEELEQKRQIELNDVVIIKSSYLDNPFLNDKIIGEIEALKSDPEYWDIYGCGNYGTISGLIYKDWETFIELPKNKKYITIYGQDYGFSNSVDAIIEIKWERGTSNLYLTEKLYKTGLDTAKLIKYTKEANPKNELVFGDCAEARLMFELKQAGINLFKPKKSILANINLIKSFNLFIQEDSLNLSKEFKHYKWMKVEGKRINKPLEFMDHLMKALAYGIRGFMSTYGGQYKVLKVIMRKKNVAA